MSHGDKWQIVRTEIMPVPNYQVHPRLVLDLDIETRLERRDELQNLGDGFHCCTSLTAALVISTSSGLIAPSDRAHVRALAEGRTPDEGEVDRRRGSNRSRLVGGIRSNPVLMVQKVSQLTLCKSGTPLAHVRTLHLNRRS